MAENYNSSYTGLQVDESVGAQTVLMTASQLGDQTYWATMPPNKILVCSQGSATYPLGSMWRRAGSELQRIGGSTENSIWYVEINTDGAQTTLILNSNILHSSRDVVVGDILISRNADVYTTTTYNSSSAKWSVTFLTNIAGNQVLYYNVNTAGSSTLQITNGSVQNGYPKANDVVISKTGDVYTVTTPGATTSSVSYQTNITGPRGLRGITGETGPRGQANFWYSGNDLYMDGSDIFWDEHDFPAGAQPGEGDLYLWSDVDTTVSGRTFYNGDVYTIVDSGQDGATLTYTTNIRGPQGPAGTLFKAQYGTTTRAEIHAALSAGFLPVVIYGNTIYYYSTSGSTVTAFRNLDTQHISVNDAGQWSGPY